MNKAYDKIVDSEIDAFVSKINLSESKKITKVLKELFFLSTDKLMNNIGSVETDKNSQVVTENWDLFIDSLTQAVQDESELWKIGIKNIKNKILTYKYFTRQDLIALDSLESYLRTEIKPFFTALQNYVDSKDFTNKFFNLPMDLLYNLVRYMFVLSPDLKESVKVTNDDLRDNINRLMELRMKVADKISKISNGYADIFDIKEMKDLCDNGAIFEDNFINRGICEFLVKLCNHKDAHDKLCDFLSGAIVLDLKKQAENTASYIAHIASIREETGAEYFSVNGEQVGKRFDNEIEMVKNSNYEGCIVDKKSRFKEPNERINPTIAPWDSNQGDMNVEGGPGGSSSGTGGGTGADFGGGGFGNADFGGEFAEPGSEGEIPGVEAGDVGKEEDGTEMPKDDDGLPEDFGTVEDNGGEAEKKSEEKK